LSGTLPPTKVTDVDLLSDTVPPTNLAIHKMVVFLNISRCIYTTYQGRYLSAKACFVLSGVAGIVLD